MPALLAEVGRLRKQLAEARSVINNESSEALAVEIEKVYAQLADADRENGRLCGRLAEARAELDRLTAPRPDPYARCGDCMCCTAAGCHRGPDSGCPVSSRTDEYACPCTGD